ncbi:MAG: autotransporter domain-containing protein [Proteobacteria bacterium]|nr:autotransporter domain-containing protein [Pseudomonadota bacterium]
MTHPLAPRRPAARPKTGLTMAACGFALIAAGAARADDQHLTKLYVFGDSMSDNGAYAASAPPGAGAFTTNPDPMWDEIVANTLRLGPLAPHAAGGTNYAEGGARVAVTSPLQRGGPDITRTPIVTQVDNFFSSGGKLDSHSLVMMVGGGNDVFAALANGPAYTSADIQDLTTAANALAGQLKRVKDAGAGVVITESIPQFDLYNQLYKSALAAAKPNVLFFDLYKLVAQIEADPGRYGIVNTTDQACNVGRIEAYLCTPSLLVSPNADQTYLFTDSIHFTGAGQAMEADGILSVLLAPNTIGQLSYVAQATGEAQRQPIMSRIGASDSPTTGAWTSFGGVTTDSQKIDANALRYEVDGSVTGATFGADYAFSPVTVAGAAVSWSSLDGNLGDQGGFAAQTVGLGVYVRHHLDRWTGWAEADYGHTDYDRIDRVVHIGRATFGESGSTGGERFSVAAGASTDLTFGAVMATPKVGLRYDHGRIAGYAEAGDDVTQITFGSQKLETLVASVGVRIQPSDAAAQVRPYLEAAYNADLLNQDRQILLVENGAPVPWTSRIDTPDAAYATFGAGVSMRLPKRLELTAGVQAVADRGPLNETTGFIGLSSRF